MEITNTKIREDGFKVTPEWLEAVGVDLENWPAVPEALKAKKEADISLMTDSPYYERIAQFTLRQIRQRCEEYAEEAVFNYGYILGKRAERARRKRGAANED